MRELSALSNQAQALQQAVMQNLTVVVPWRWQQVTAWSTAAYMTSSAPLQEPCVPWPAAPLLHVARPPSIGMNAAHPPSVNATNPPSVGMNARNPPPAIASHRADPVATKPPAVLGDERSRASPPPAVHACLSFLCAVAGSDEGGGGVVVFRGVTVEPQGRRRAIPLGD